MAMLLSMQRCQQKHLLFVLVAMAMASRSMHEAAATNHRDSIQFPSSVIFQNGDLSLRPNQSNCRMSPENKHGLRIAHSNIDRDPINIEDDQVFDELFHDMQETFSTDRQWKSPLERINLLHPEPYDPVNSIQKPTTIKIHDGPRNNHQIVASGPSQTNLPIKARKTGTTITALLACNSTVLILAADTRATDGTTVADSNCEKLHQLSMNVWCAGAGTSGDVEAIVRNVKFMFWKRGMSDEIGNMGRNVQCLTSNGEDNVPLASLLAILHCLRTQLLKTRGQLGVNLLVGGYDPPSQRAILAAIHPHGSMDVVTYGALGSGGLAATGVLESRYPQIGSGKCSLEEGIRLAVDAVRAGVENDLGSGSRVDVCIISKEGVLYRRAVVREETLEWMNAGSELTGAKRVERTVDGVGGVNGFGNVPFAIQSERVVHSSELLSQRNKKQWLDKVIGAKHEK